MSRSSHDWMAIKSKHRCPQCGGQWWYPLYEVWVAGGAIDLERGDTHVSLPVVDGERGYDECANRKCGIVVSG